MFFHATKLGDDEIEDRVAEVFEKHPNINSGLLEISVQHGVVTLTGQLPNESMRDTAIAEVEKIEAVSLIVNRIAIEVQIEEIDDDPTDSRD